MTTNRRTGGYAGEVHVLRRSYSTQDMAAMRAAIDAVCGELGIANGPASAREAVARRVMTAYATGPRQPLNLVHAGLGELCA